MNFHVRCTPGRTTKFFCKKSREKFAKPKKLLTFAIPNRHAGREKRGISSVGRAFEWHSKGQEFDSPMLHKKSSASAGFFCAASCSFLRLLPSAAPSLPPYWRTLIYPRGSSRGTCRAPRAVIGLWRTATIDTAHRNGISVRLFGDGGCPGGEKSLSSYRRNNNQ